MADIVQTYILKVNIGCCNACPRTLHKLLLNNKGVEKYEVNQEENIVSVTGKINLYQLLKDIKKKIKKNAELIKKESSDSEKKQQRGKEDSESEKKHPSQKSQEHMAPPEQFSGDPFSRDEFHHPYTVQMPPSPYHHPYMVQQLQPPHHHLYTVQQPQPQPPYRHLYTVQMPPPYDHYGYPYHYNH